MNTKIELIKEWKQAQLDVASVKAYELKLRKEVLNIYPGEIGSSMALVPDLGIELKITRGVLRKIDEGILNTVWKDLSELEQSCIAYKPSLITKVYSVLEEGSMLSRAITVKPSLPSIKVVKLDVD